MAKSITLSDDVKDYYKGHIDHGAWEICLKGEMIRKGIVEEEESAKYLLDYIEDTRKKGIPLAELDSLRVGAAGSILKRRGEAVLSSLVSEFEDQFKKEPRDSNGSLTERHNILRRKTRILKQILREKKEKQEKEKEKAKTQ